jgi:hypothetical protein
VRGCYCPAAGILNLPRIGRDFGVKPSIVWTVIRLASDGLGRTVMHKAIFGAWRAK